MNRHAKIPPYVGRTATIRKMESSYTLPEGLHDGATVTVLAFDHGYFSVDHNGRRFDKVFCSSVIFPTVTPEQFHHRLEQIVQSKYPAASLAFNIRSDNNHPVRTVIKRSGKFLFTSGQPITAADVQHWIFTVWRKGQRRRSTCCGSVDVHTGAIRECGIEFAERVGRQLLALASRFD